MAENPHETLEEAMVPLGEAPVPADEDAAVPPGANGHARAAPADAEDGLIDWDVKIEVPPTRPAQTLTVRFVEGGKRPLAIPDDPRD